jgi:hypothetical protein
VLRALKNVRYIKGAKSGQIKAGQLGRLMAVFSLLRRIGYPRMGGLILAAKKG